MAEPTPTRRYGAATVPRPYPAADLAAVWHVVTATRASLGRAGVTAPVSELVDDLALELSDLTSAVLINRAVDWSARVLWERAATSPDRDDIAAGTYQAALAADAHAVKSRHSGDAAVSIDRYVEAHADTPASVALAAPVVLAHASDHLRLIGLEISKLLPRLPDWDAGDLFTYGFLGLRKAVRKYEPATGNAFSTYAVHKINGEIRDGIRSEHHLPKRSTTLARKISDTENELTQRLGRPPTTSELAAELAVGADWLASTRPLLAAPAHLEEVLPLTDEATLLRLPTSLIDESNPADAAVAAALRGRLADALDLLPAEQSAAVRARYLLDLSPGAAAESLGVSARRYRQLTRAGLATLRDLLSDWSDPREHQPAQDEIHLNHAETLTSR